MKKKVSRIMKYSTSEENFYFTMYGNLTKIKLIHEAEPCDKKVRLGTANKNNVFLNETFMSTRVGLKFVNIFSNCCLFSLQVLPGSRCLFVGSLSYFPQEMEVLFAPGRQLFVTKNQFKASSHEAGVIDATERIDARGKDTGSIMNNGVEMQGILSGPYVPHFFRDVREPFFSSLPFLPVLFMIWEKYRLLNHFTVSTDTGFRRVFGHTARCPRQSEECAMDGRPVALPSPGKRSSTFSVRRRLVILTTIWCRH
jgi:hypothetical protein